MTEFLKRFSLRSSSVGPPWVSRPLREALARLTSLKSMRVALRSFSAAMLSARQRLFHAAEPALQFDRSVVVVDAVHKCIVLEFGV